MEGGVGRGDEKKFFFSFFSVVFLESFNTQIPMAEHVEGFYTDAGGQGQQLGVPQGTTAAEAAAGGKGECWIYCSSAV